jgi:hypothetical protein
MRPGPIHPIFLLLNELLLVAAHMLLLLLRLLGETLGRVVRIPRHRTSS